MSHQYTRQRQGRDFSILYYLHSEGNNSNIDSIAGNNGQKDENEQQKSLLCQLEHHKAETKRNSVPIDGHEPALEKGR